MDTRHADAHSVLPHNSCGFTHDVALYERDEALIDRLARFVGGAVAGGETTIVVATREHHAALASTLCARGVVLSTAREKGLYLSFDAADALDQIMVGGVPDETRFRELLGETVAQAARAGARVHVFGEMVGLLWGRGQHRAAILLEALWNTLGQTLPLSLLCAYPIDVLARDPAAEEFREICATHSRVLPGESFTSASDATACLRAAAELQMQAQIVEQGDADRARLAAIVESSDDAIVGKTLDGIVTSWNLAAERMFGYSAEEMIGQSILRIVPPDRTDDVSRILTAIGRGERVEHFESERVRKDGRRIKVSLTVSPIRNAASGRIVGASKIARDITEQKRAERERQKVLRQLATLYRVSQTVAAELKSEAVLQTICEAAIDLAGAKSGAFVYSVAEAGALPPIHGAARSALEDHLPAQLLARTFSGPVLRIADLHQESQLRTTSNQLPPEEEAAPASYLGVPVVSRNGDVFGAIVLTHPEPDVFAEQAERAVVALAAQAAVALDHAKSYEAEQRARAAAEEANGAKDKFLAMLGHELRTPLATVRNSIVAAVMNPARSQRALELARHGTDQLSRLVDDLLDVSRITQGRIKLCSESASFDAIVESAIESLRPLFEERAVTLMFSRPPQEVRLQGDAARLEQIVGNLLTNAAKYTANGGGVTVSLRHMRGQAVLRVHDNGIGIAPDLLPKVFDLFVQGDQALDRAQGGLGIGLTLVRQLVEMHGGKVEARSRGLGHGSEFIVRLPVTCDAQLAHAQTSSASQSLSKVRVLIVEDHSEAAESLGMLLELLGMDVRCVRDGFAALTAACAAPPDIMLIDIGLPGMNGYELAQLIRREESLRHVKLVALTGYGQEEDRQRALAAGFDRHLTKPAHLEVIEEIIADVTPALAAV